VVGFTTYEILSPKIKIRPGEFYHMISFKDLRLKQPYDSQKERESKIIPSSI